MAGQQFYDILAMDTLGTKGPANSVRLMADATGIVWISSKGAAKAFFFARLATALLGNADATVLATTASEFTLPPATLSANRSVTLGTAGAVAGEVIRIVRLDKTAFTLAIINGGAGAGTLITLPVSAGRIADFVFDGTNWALSGVVRLA